MKLIDSQLRWLRMAGRRGRTWARPQGRPEAFDQRFPGYSNQRNLLATSSFHHSQGSPAK